jgi:hypothetical protein
MATPISTEPRAEDHDAAGVATRRPVAGSREQVCGKGVSGVVVCRQRSAEHDLGGEQ